MQWTISALMSLCLLGAAGPVQAATSISRSAKARTSLVITREMYQPPGPTGWPVHAAVSRAVLAVFTLRYRDATHWQVEGRYLAAPHDPFLLRQGTLATPFSPFPGAVVQQGKVISHYDAHHRLVLQISASSDGMNPLRGNASLYLDDHPVSGLGALLAWERHCRPAAVQGTQIIAGRRAYVVTLGLDRCTALGPGYLSAGRAVAWLDAATFVLLRLDRFFPESQRLLVETVTTRVTYSDAR